MDKERRGVRYDFSVLRELRSRRKITLESLAAATGISFSTLTRIETNQNQPSLATLASLAEYFGMHPSQLLELASPAMDQREERSGTMEGGLRWREVVGLDVTLATHSGRAGTRSPVHVESGMLRIIWVLRGHLVVTAQNIEHDLMAGRAVRLDASVEHGCRLVDDSEYVVATFPKRSR